MKQIRFLCGCTFPLKIIHVPIDETTSKIEYQIEGRTAKDANGLLLCLDHMQRRYGWRSLPMVHQVSHEDDGEAIELDREDHRFASCTHAEIEQYVVFGVLPKALAA